MTLRIVVVVADSPLTNWRQSSSTVDKPTVGHKSAGKRLFDLADAAAQIPLNNAANQRVSRRSGRSALVTNTQNAARALADSRLQVAIVSTCATLPAAAHDRAMACRAKIA